MKFEHLYNGFFMLMSMASGVTGCVFAFKHDLPTATFFIALAVWFEPQL